jgi:hypothetical protein
MLLFMQAAAAGSAQQYQLAESFFLKAKRPDAALSMYKEAGQWQAALKLAEAYLPNSVQVRFSWGQLENPDIPCYLNKEKGVCGLGATCIRLTLIPAVPATGWAPD